MSRAIALGFLFLAYSQLFRYLGPFGSGQYQFVLSYVLIFSTVVDFGVQQFITKKMSEDPENTKQYFRDFLKFELIIAILLYAVLLSIAYFKNFETIIFQAVAVTGLGMVVNALCYPFLAVMTAKQDLKKVALINFINSLVNITIIFLAIYLKKNIVFLASIQLVFGILDLFLYRIFVKKHLEINNSNAVAKNILITGSSVVSILKHAWPFAILVGFSAIYNRIDIIIISKILSYEQVGLYTAAYKFLDILNFFPASVSHVLFPILAALMAANSLLDVKSTIEKYLRFMIFAALPIAVGAMVLSKRLMLLIAGREFEASAPILSILIWAAAILFIYIPVNSLIISQLTKKAALVTGANMVVNIVGNILLVPHYGIKAAAFMTIFSEAVQCVFYFYFVRRDIIYFEFLPYLWQPALASAIMGGVLYLIRNGNLAYSIIAGGLVYIIGLIIFGFVKREDWEFIKNFFKSKAEQPSEPITP